MDTELGKSVIGGLDGTGDFVCRSCIEEDEERLAKFTSESEDSGCVVVTDYDEWFQGGECCHCGNEVPTGG